jgi:hypothetical protein
VENFQNRIGHSFDIYPHITFCTLDIIYGEVLLYFKPVRLKFSFRKYNGSKITCSKRKQYGVR